MNQNILANVIYDTLMQNTQHEQLELEQVEDQQIDNTTNTIEFSYCGKMFEISVREIKE
jgi:hypothetical protein